MARLRHIFVSPGHNYFGHHDQPSGKHPIVEVEHVECVAGRGLRGDRFFDYKEDYKGQVTLFSWEVFDALRRERGQPELSPAVLRRNLLVEGVDLNVLSGVQFELQGVVLESSGECKPCYWMDEAVGAGAEEWLKGRGGLRCKIITGGTLRRE
jgi:MOSC domain-containing protein YiiM